MKFSFKALLGAFPSRDRTTHEIVAYRVWIKKEERKNRRTSDRLKLAKAVREGGEDKFIFSIQTDDFCAAYNLNVHIKALSKTIAFWDIGYALNILPSDTITLLESNLEE